MLTAVFIKGERFGTFDHSLCWCRTGDVLDREYCFKYVSSGAADIEEECIVITEGTCPLHREDLENGIANQRSITEEDEENNMKSMLLREFSNSRKRLSLSNPSRHWPNNEIPYLLR